MNKLFQNIIKSNFVHWILPSFGGVGGGFILLFLSLTGFSQAYQQEIPTDYGYIVKLGQTVPDFDLVLPNGNKT
ncbi:MAG: hypothetical protein JW735_01670, partial [Prolixibacteraceae bacterium]|nr:hypothetical protein [Prolixibacteraceae bacterium]